MVVNLITTLLAHFFLSQGIRFRLSCPHTSPQNGKAERVIRSINNILRTLLIQAGLPPAFWADALHTATHLFNLHPTKVLKNLTPHQALFGSKPSYSHLRAFGCRCYPNLSATTPHKLAPRSTECIFLGYPSDHKGYRCLDLKSNKIITSRHVVFDELTFPYAARTSTLASSYSFLDDFADDDTVLLHLCPACSAHCRQEDRLAHLDPRRTGLPRRLTRPNRRHPRRNLLQECRRR